MGCQLWPPACGKGERGGENGLGPGKGSWKGCALIWVVWLISPRRPSLGRKRELDTIPNFPIAHDAWEIRIAIPFRGNPPHPNRIARGRLVGCDFVGRYGRIELELYVCKAPANIPETWPWHARPPTPCLFPRPFSSAERERGALPFSNTPSPSSIPMLYIPRSLSPLFRFPVIPSPPPPLIVPARRPHLGFTPPLQEPAVSNLARHRQCGASGPLLTVLATTPYAQPKPSIGFRRLSNLTKSRLRPRPLTKHCYPPSRLRASRTITTHHRRNAKK
jgi:hypothetical protein